MRSIETEVVSGCGAGIERDISDLHSVEDAARAGSDGDEGACSEGSCSDDSGFGSRRNRSSGPTGSIDFHHVRAPQVDGTLDPERAAHRILSWFDDDHGTAQGRSKSERVGDVVERKSAATVPARCRIVIDVNDGRLTASRQLRAHQNHYDDRDQWWGNEKWEHSYFFELGEWIHCCSFGILLSSFALFSLAIIADKG
jgi:hypothetical protein